MASLYVNYFADANRNVALGLISNEVITTSGTSAAGGAIPTGAKIVSVTSTVAHYVTFGTGTPTAAAGTGFYLPANGTREFIVSHDGGAIKVAGITV